mmetsp:Transcript_39526/g.61629  ORF Transcript_39526/g.61629 Transcript_39526/m.61629 type:complete len:182 (+) Transcript_39526:171-716(+)
MKRPRDEGSDHENEDGKEQRERRPQGLRGDWADSVPCSSDIIPWHHFDSEEGMSMEWSGNEEREEMRLLRTSIETEGFAILDIGPEQAKILKKAFHTFSIHIPLGPVNGPGFKRIGSDGLCGWNQPTPAKEVFRIRKGDPVMRQYRTVNLSHQTKNSNFFVTDCYTNLNQLPRSRLSVEVP